jgi:tetratricopeptide (TPR) repeat protein
MSNLKTLLPPKAKIYFIIILFSTVCLYLFYIAWKEPTFPDEISVIPVRIIKTAQNIKEKDKQVQVYDSLKIVLNSILLKKPNNDSLIYYLGYAYILTNETDSAKKLLTEGIKKSPKNPALYNMLGYSYFIENNLKEAEYYFLQAYKLDPNNNDANKFLSTIKKKSAK